MKLSKRMIALLLCAAMVFGMIGCTQNPTETQPPTEPPTEAPTEPPADQVYQDAADALNGKTDISLDLLITKTTTVAGEMFTEQSQQKLTYAGIGSDTPQISMEETLRYNIHKEEDEKDSEDDEETICTYSEIYADGTLYTNLSMEYDDEKEEYFLSSALTAEDIAGRYIPAVLLDAALYEELSSKRSGSDTTISFTAPTAAESWAIPEGAEMLGASGSAVVGDSGTLKQMNYTVTYQYGPAEIKLEVESKPQTDVASITVPEDSDRYTLLQYPDALRTYLNAVAMSSQADSVSVSSMESIYIQAAGLVQNQSTTMNTYGSDEDLMAKIETSIYFMNYGTNEEERLEHEELYLDGKYTVTVDDGVPTSQTGVSHEDIEEYCYQIMNSRMVDPGYWQDVTVTDLGSVYLIEYTFSEDFGNNIQNSLCSMFWDDPSFLNQYASAYVNNETTGYLAMDKYTGIPTSSGYYFEGTHTIEGTEYTISLQSDQSTDAPGKGAYHEITEEMPEEAEPEVKPTPLFYHVTGVNGQEMWLLGTIHVGDERTAYLPEEIYNAFAASDALALEINSEAFDEQMDDDEQLQDQVSDAYYYSGGKMLKDLMEEEEYAKAVQYMKASGNYNMNSPYLKASIWSQSIDNFYLRQGYALHGDQGVEERLHAWAEELEKPIREVESSLFQIRMMTNYSDELQLLLLEESMESDAMENWTGTWELYEKWCAGDEEALREAINEEVDTSEMTEEELAEYEEAKPLIDEYNKAMSYDRNEDMLKVAIDYLRSGDVVFYAVGLAHLLDETNGLVDALKEAGYTVELVEYAQ